jgi:hypothetical protein
VTKDYFEHRYIALAVFGAIIDIYGTFQHFPQIYYICGSIAMLITAIHYRLFYFIALELILTAGHSAIVLGVGPYTQFSLPILLCLQLLIFYLMMSKENSIFLLIGIIGIALLSVGLAYDNQWIFFIGSTSIAVYAYYSGAKGRHAAYVWAVLNTLFAAIALYKLYNM